MQQRFFHRFSRELFVAILLIIAILAVYGQVVNHDFIQFDDNAYLLDNPHVRTGITFNNIIWAFASFDVSNWHPLTWLSHMADVQFFGMAPGSHHLMSVALHLANTLLLFHLLCRISGAFLRSASVAALFAIHPLHVESVAWIAERKDVLSALFFLLTLNLYAGYAEHRKRGSYLLALFTFVLGLMAKPMLVTLPFVLLLLDYWPLRRTTANCGPDGFGSASGPSKSSILELLREKIPFLLLSAASCAVTIMAQHNATASLDATALSVRIANALVAYLGYIGKMLWPFNLAVFYPFPESIPLWQPVVAAVMLTAVSLMVVRERRRPWLIVGWLWYLGTLVPVIGIVMVGLQSMADRYTYIPMIGIYIMAVWWISDMSPALWHRRSVLALLAAVVFSVLSVVTWRQVSFWRNTTTLFSHALDVTSGNYLAHFILGREAVKSGQYNQAHSHFDEAARIAPWYEKQRSRQGVARQEQERLDAEIASAYESVRQNPGSAAARIGLGIVLARNNKLDQAVENFTMAVSLDPQSAAGHYNLGLTLGRLGRFDEAVANFSRALQVTPNAPDIRNNLGIAFAELGRLDEAIEQFKLVLALEPDHPEARKNLELVLGKKSHE
ncbi:MAG: tetratricopeptide repeat protein [Geobacteraceae bacterium]|nr:tetratricopeptide repeat protein [Geobacteraceae bacterium]